jgi:4-amino-4-deoxy-L-arabinose transferase-like glycosyltransferase
VGGVMLLVLRIINGGDARLWLVLGVVMGIGVLNKVSMLWFAAGLFVGLVLTPERRWLRTPWPWIAAAITGACAVPFFVWQMSHGWPFIGVSRNAATIKVGAISPLSFVGQQLLGLNVMAAPLMWRRQSSPVVAGADGHGVCA